MELKPYQVRALDRLRDFLERARLSSPEEAYRAVTAGDPAASRFATPYAPLAGIPDTPYCCLRLPTGGGKRPNGQRSHVLPRLDYLGATETYMRLALKAQVQSRAAIEALDRLANGHVQTVKHVHVDNRGGQAVIAENVQTGGQRNGKIDDQSHAAGAAGVSAPLLGADPLGNGMPIPSCEGAEAVPAARRDESRCT